MQNSKKMPLDKRLATGFLVNLCRLLTGIRARWLAPLPEDQVRIYYANHSSHLDGMVIWASMPAHLRQRVRPVAAADYWLTSNIRRYVATRLFNSVLVKRRASAEADAADNPLAQMSEPLRKGESLIIFPEGTRGDGEAIVRFKSGIWHLSRLYPQAELVPVYLENLNRVLPKGSRLIVPILCSATFGKPVAPCGEKEEKQAFLQRVKEELEALKP
ncbi:lysophospholipid acyltransferase family protein [Kalamiella sp. sgz302252]|uniref:lysophospholipid acyltransferase family protein n=1 Tax=Pantoea sp. sgz302252 TaxID=3341827 RepID=UPI0036D29CD3